MLDTSQDEPQALPSVAEVPLAEVPPARAAAPPVPLAPEGRGCLFALSQPPLMIFLGVIGALLLFAAVHDLYLL
ncbi:hypothetical protein Slala03_37920 [Streptomyces lavendulae subsp. lavendulae]|uniref:hypothetical protein n=1 Tax=Streptomyces lavendulae TaxID=1914 RepID=UPI0024A1495F|nr:hypothetical protein [Streptomyces lavendulae]GLV84103.1 hypothetical protein Slala03_37920 [Streptomyces lavendulae subsp. lavendulae]